MVAGATSRSHALISVLAALLRAVALVDGIVCLYILVQALALTARERRSTIAVLRATGAGGREVRLVLVGAALLMVAGAAPAAVALELLVLGPGASRLAAGYVSLPLDVGVGQVAIVTGRAACPRAGGGSVGCAAPAARTRGGRAEGGLSGAAAADRASGSGRARRLWRQRIERRSG